MTAFEEMGVLEEIGRAVEEMDWTLPTDVQAEAIPLILGGGDVLMAAETGSGKTGAFCLPILQIVHETIRDLDGGDKNQDKSRSRGKAEKRPSQQCILNVYDRTESMAIDPDGLLCQSRDTSGWHGCRATRGLHSAGKFYYEATVTDEGLCRVGWATQSASLELGTDRFGYGFGGTGKKSFGKQFDSYGESFAMGDCVGCLLDLDNGLVSWSKNGLHFGTAFYIDDRLKGETFFPAVALKNAEIRFNFGDSPFQFGCDGFVGVSKAPEKFSRPSGKSTGSTGARKKTTNAPYAIIIEPSRELAEQTLNQIDQFKKHLKGYPIRQLLAIGGIGAKDQMDALRTGVEIVCGTPGRLDDLISSGQLSLDQVRFFVLDEADSLVSRQQGHAELIYGVHRKIPKVTSDGKRLQMIVCSATLHNFEVKKMAEKLMHFPVWIDLKGQDSVPETVHHVVCSVDPTRDRSWKELPSNRHIATDGVHANDNLHPGHESAEMLSEAVKILKGEYLVRAILEHRMQRALIFCRTKIDCDNAERYLQQIGMSLNRPNDFSCVCLHGDRKPQERKANLEKFKRNEVRFLICTDVAARGIDITGLPYVINVTLPDDKQSYVHRIGRVGRAERMGLAISFSATVHEKVWYHQCASRGRGCYNTRLLEQNGCCKWYNEKQYLADIEEHLGVTIDQIGPDMKVPVNEFDGKVVYGQKQKSSGTGYEGHVESLAPTVKELARLETDAQRSYLQLRFFRGSNTA